MWHGWQISIIDRVVLVDGIHQTPNLLFSYEESETLESEVTFQECVPISDKARTNGLYFCS